MQPLEAPTILHEAYSEPIEQLRMCRRLTRKSEIIRRLDDSASKMVLPDAVHKYSRTQRIIRAGHPPCECQPITACRTALRGLINVRLSRRAKHGWEARL